MFTNCPNCSRQFRIRASQLAAAEGLVQCGFCGKQFNALERLYDKPLVIEEKSIGPAPEERADEPDFHIPEIADEVESTAAAYSEAEHDAAEFRIELPSAETEEEQQAAEEKVPPASAAPESLPFEKPAEIEFPFPAELEQEEKPKAGVVSRLLWSFGVLLLLLGGVSQAAWFNRDILLTRYPQLLPYARQLCQQLECTLIRNRNISAIKIVNRDVRVHPRYEDALLVNATITNLSKYKQRFPQVLLSLFDANGQVIAYRQIPPSSYLDSSIDREAGMQPDTPIHFVFEVANSSTEAVSFEFDFL